MQEDVLDAENLAVTGQRDFGIVGLAALLRGGEEMLEPVLDPFDRPVEFFAGPGKHDFLRIEQHDLRAEAAADERRDDPHLPLAQAQHGGKAVAQKHRRLRGVPDGEVLGAGVPVGDDAAGLDRHRGAVIVVKAARDDVIGVGAGGGVIAATLAHMGGDVAFDVVVDARGSVDERLFQIDDRGQRLKIDGDVRKRVLGDIAALCQHDRERLADVAHLVLGERHLRALIENHAGDRRRRHQQRPRRPVRAEIGGGVDRDDARPRARRANVDGANAGVRHAAAQKRRVQHAGQFDVVDEQRLAAEQPGVLVALDRRAEAARAHGARPCIRSAASMTASTMC